ncbi:MAG TPA: tRNA-guanine transglycosylase, partial [Alphaproteobacteria bacterium]|nr:tRNA-guanine transglycosylase [Alphaproteobacteria bacterium]
MSYPGFSFEILHRDPASHARLGRLETPHGIIETPNYIFCGTKASIKTLNPDQVRTAGADIILANTYHLMLQPGADLIARMGGLHKFTGWSGPMLTDSGGFQVFSMGHGSVADEIKGRNRN